MDGSKIHWVRNWAKILKGVSPMCMVCTLPTTPLSEGYFCPFEWQGADIKGEYQTLSIITL